MKIGVIGNYGHLNLGDEALLLGAIDCVVRGAGMPAADVVVLSDDRRDTAARLRTLGCEVRQLRRPFDGRLMRLPAVVFDIFRALRGLDWLVFGGGGLINDSNRTAIPLYGIIVLLARIRGIQMTWWAVGLGPLDRGIRWKLAAWLLRASSYTTVRDVYSAALARQLTGREFPVTPDLAHAIAPPRLRGGLDSKRVAVSVVPYRKPGVWFEADKKEYATYCGKMVSIMRGLLDSGANLSVTLLPISLEQDSEAIGDILELGQFELESRVQVASANDVEALMRELDTVDVAIATRLHSVVLSSISGVPTVTIAYQPKVASYAEELGLNLPLFDIVNFDVSEVVQAVLDVYEERAEYASRLECERGIRQSRLQEAADQWRKLLRKRF